jgi:hypothetical protein
VNAVRIDNSKHLPIKYYLLKVNDEMKYAACFVTVVILFVWLGEEGGEEEVGGGRIKSLPLELSAH